MAARCREARDARIDVSAVVVSMVGQLEREDHLAAASRITIEDHSHDLYAHAAAPNFTR